MWCGLHGHAPPQAAPRRPPRTWSRVAIFGGEAHGGAVPSVTCKSLLAVSVTPTRNLPCNMHPCSTAGPEAASSAGARAPADPCRPRPPSGQNTRIWARWGALGDYHPGIEATPHDADRAVGVIIDADCDSEGLRATDELTVTPRRRCGTVVRASETKPTVIEKDDGNVLTTSLVLPLFTTPSSCNMVARSRHAARCRGDGDLRREC